MPECSNPIRERIYSHPQTDCFVVSQLFSVARHVGHLKLGSKPAQLYVRLACGFYYWSPAWKYISIICCLDYKIQMSTDLRKENHFTLEKKRSRNYNKRRLESNSLSFLLRCSTRPYEGGAQWDSNSFV